MSTPVGKEMLELSHRLCVALADHLSPEGLDLFYTYDALMSAVRCREIVGEDLYQVIIQGSHEALATDVLEEAEAIAAQAWDGGHSRRQ